MSSSKCVLYVLVSAAAANAQYIQQTKLSSTSGPGLGVSVAVSADGSTAIVGGPLYNNQAGAAWVFARSNGTWVQQAQLVASDASGIEHQGSSVAISADGNTAAVGADGTYNGGTWVYIRNNGAWTQQGLRLLGTGGNAGPAQGKSVALSADGNTLAVGAAEDNFANGAVWIFTRSGNAWNQQAKKLAGLGATGAFVRQGFSIGLSADGNTLISGGPGDGNNIGAAWIFTRSGGTWTQQGDKLAGAGAVSASLQKLAVAISGDGNTAILGRDLDNAAVGAAWVFTRTNGAWSQQGGRLTGTGWVGSPQQGSSVALSGDGNTAVIGGPDDSSLNGAAWVFKRTNGAWTQQGNRLAASGGGFQGSGVAVSADASTILVADISNTIVFAGPASTTAVPGGTNPFSGSGTTQQFTFTFSDSAGWENLVIANVLFNAGLDGRQACYIAFLPSGSNSGTVLVVDDAGDAGGPFSQMTLPGNGIASNSQCSITGSGSTVSAAGDTLTLTLPITFTPSFSGSKVIYTATRDGSSNSGWIPVGTWNNASATAAGPGVGLVSPGRTTGFTATYTFNFTDTNGWQDIAVANVLVAGALDARNACYVAFVPVGATSGIVLLVDDAGDAGGPFGNLPLPGSGSVSNGECTINAAGSGVSASGTNLALTLSITFTPGFTGNRILYLATRTGSQNTGWQPAATAAVQ
jgi:hypothetical protein